MLLKEVYLRARREVTTGRANCQEPKECEFKEEPCSRTVDGKAELLHPGGLTAPKRKQNRRRHQSEERKTGSEEPWKGTMTEGI